MILVAGINVSSCPRTLGIQRRIGLEGFDEET